MAAIAVITYILVAPRVPNWQVSGVVDGKPGKSRQTASNGRRRRALMTLNGTKHAFNTKRELYPWQQQLSN
jgi:hypothetical protein